MVGKCLRPRPPRYVERDRQDGDPHPAPAIGPQEDRDGDGDDEREARRVRHRRQDEEGTRRHVAEAVAPLYRQQGANAAGDRQEHGERVPGQHVHGVRPEHQQHEAGGKRSHPPYGPARERVEEADGGEDGRGGQDAKGDVVAPEDLEQRPVDGARGQDEVPAVGVDRLSHREARSGDEERDLVGRRARPAAQVEDQGGRDDHRGREHAEGPARRIGSAAGVRLVAQPRAEVPDARAGLPRGRCAGGLSGHRGTL